MDVLNETLTFEDSLKFKEYTGIKEHGDDTDKALEKLCCPGAGTCPLKAADEKELIYEQSISSSLNCPPLAIPLAPGPASPRVPWGWGWGGWFLLCDAPESSSPSSFLPSALPCLRGACGRTRTVFGDGWEFQPQLVLPLSDCDRSQVTSGL